MVTYLYKNCDSCTTRWARFHSLYQSVKYHTSCKHFTVTKSYHQKPWWSDPMSLWDYWCSVGDWISRSHGNWTLVGPTYCVIPVVKPNRRNKNYHTHTHTRSYVHHLFIRTLNATIIIGHPQMESLSGHLKQDTNHTTQCNLSSKAVYTYYKHTWTLVFPQRMKHSPTFCPSLVLTTAYTSLFDTSPPDISNWST